MGSFIPNTVEVYKPVEAGDTVNTSFNYAKDTAASALEDLQDFSDKVTQAYTAFSWVTSSADYGWFDDAEINAAPDLWMNRSSSINFSHFKVENIDEPSEVELEPVVTPSIENAPALQADFPTIVIPETPSTTLPTDPGDPPSVDAVDKPTKPTYTLPTLPQLDSITIPDTPDNAITPTLDADLPAFEALTAPANTFNYVETSYSSDLLTAITAKLLTDVQNGGTGLGTAVEAAIWGRASDRARDQYETDYDTALISNPGFDMPPGALMARLDYITAEKNRSLTNITNEIAIEQARLAQTNTHFYLEKGINIEQVLIDNNNQFYNRTLDSAKFAITSAVEIYKNQVLSYNTKLERYKIASAAYEAKVRAAMIELEKYKAKIDAQRFKVETQQQQVDLYRTQFEAVKVLVDTYRTETEVAQLQLESDKIRLQAFAQEVEIYKTKVDAKTSEFNLWNAQLAGEVERVKAYQGQVDAYRAQVDAHRTTVEIERLKSDITLAENNQKIESKKIGVEVFKTQLQKAIAQVDTYVKGYGIDASMHEADTKVLAAQASLEVEAYKANIQKATNKTELEIKEAEVNMRQNLNELQLTLKQLDTQMNVQAQIAASALSSIHASASLSHSTGNHITFSDNKSESTSKVESESTNTNTNTSVSTNTTTSTSTSTVDSTSNNTTVSTSSNTNNNTSVSTNTNNSTINSTSDNTNKNSSSSVSVQTHYNYTG